MSDYFGLAIHPVSGVLHHVEYLDNYYGPHQYAVRFDTGIYDIRRVPQRNLSCRRCTECDGMEHHWLDNSAFGNGKVEGALKEFTHVCKHCDAVGVVCGDCDGSGRCPVDPVSGGCCTTCSGEGVRGQ